MAITLNNPKVKQANMPLYRKYLLDFMFNVKRNQNIARYEKSPKFYLQRIH